MPTVLFHTNNEAKKAQIFALCRTLHFAARAIAPDDAGQAVGALAGLSAGAPVEKLPAGYALPEVLIFSGDAGEALDVFLAAYPGRPGSSRSRSRPSSRRTTPHGACARSSRSCRRSAPRCACTASESRDGTLHKQS